MSTDVMDYKPTRDLIAVGRRVLAAVGSRGPGAIRFAVYADRALAPMPALAKDWMVEQLVALLHGAIGQLHEHLDTAEEMVDAAGTPKGLRRAADEWDVRLIGPAGELAPRIRLDVLEAAQESAWTGSGAQLYRMAMEGQSASVARVADYAGQISGTLRGLADALDAFVAQVTVGVVVMVGSAITLLASVASFSTVVGIGVSILGALSSVVGLAGSLLGFLSTLGSTMTSMATLTREAVPSIIPWPNARFGGAR
jgi:hypothetical protein